MSVPVRLGRRLLMTSIHSALRALWFVFRPHVYGAAAIVVTPAGRVVLVRHSYRPHWYLPGGGRKRDEPAEAAILRELREEIGLTAHASLREIGTFLHRPDHRHGHTTLFLASGAEYRFRPSLEIEAAIEVDPENLPADCAERTRTLIAEWLATGQGGEPAS